MDEATTTAPIINAISKSENPKTDLEQTSIGNVKKILCARDCGEGNDDDDDGSVSRMA